MMNLDKDKRASTEELMVHPSICYWLRDRRLKEMHVNTKRKEEEIGKKEKSIKEKEMEIEEKMKEIE
jgi:hypothetical protein